MELRNTSGSGGGAALTVTDGITSVTNTSIIDFIAGATVTNAGGGQANITISASATSITVGTTTVGSGTNGRVLYDNSGVLGEMTNTGSGTVNVLQTSPTLITPVLGVASYTTLSGGNITDSALTAGRITFAGTAGILKDDSTLTYATSGGLLVNNVYAKFGTASPALAVTKGVDFYYNDNTTSGAEIGIGNTSNGTSAYAGVYLNNDLASDGLVDHFGGIFINSSGYTDTTFGTALAVANLMIVQNTDAPIAYCASHATLGAHIFYLGNTVVGGFATVATTNETGRFTTTQGTFSLGLAGTAGGVLKLAGATSGTQTIQTVAAAGAKTFTVDASTTLSNVVKTSVGFTVDGGGSAITTGKVKGFFTCPYAGTITAWNIVADAGTCTIKVWKIATGTAKPTSANSINTSGVALSSGTAVHSTTLSDFTSTTVTANDIFAFNIEAIATATELSMNLEITKS